MLSSDPAEAAAEVARGGRVVLVVTGPSEVGAVPGRLAMMVGEPGDAAVMAAARDMEAELFAAPLVRA